MRHNGMKAIALVLLLSMIVTLAPARNAFAQDEYVSNEESYAFPYEGEDEQLDETEDISEGEIDYQEPQQDIIEETEVSDEAIIDTTYTDPSLDITPQTESPVEPSIEPNGSMDGEGEDIIDLSIPSSEKEEIIETEKIVQKEEKTEKQKQAKAKTNDTKKTKEISEKKEETEIKLAEESTIYSAPAGSVAYTVKANNTPMFNVVDAYSLKKSGKDYLYITLNGMGYHEIFKGTYEEAVATKGDSKKWIIGSIRSDGSSFDGKYQFAIPIQESDSYIQIQALSDGHKKDGWWWYPRYIKIDQKKHTLESGDYEETIPLTIENDTEDFNVEKASIHAVAGPHSNNFNVSADITLKGYTKAYFGGEAEASKAKEGFVEPTKDVFSFTLEKIIGSGTNATISSILDKATLISFYSNSERKWKEASLTFSKKNKSLVITAKSGKEEKPDKNIIEDNKGDNEQNSPNTKPQKNDTGNNTTNTDKNKKPSKSDKDKKPSKSDKDKTSAKDENKDADNKLDDSQNKDDNNPVEEDNTTISDEQADTNVSGGLSDGTYTLDSFSFRGGTGKVQITADKVSIRGGKAYLTISFSSPYWTYVKAGGGTYNCSVSGNSSIVEIPVILNQNNKIIGLTTKMSQAHEIEYTIFPYLEAAKGSASTEGSMAAPVKSEIATSADTPELIGLDVQKEISIDSSELIKMYEFNDDIIYAEVDLAKDPSDEDKDEEKKDDKDSKDNEKKDAKDADEKKDFIEIDGEVVQPSEAEKTAALYKEDTIKYLFVPEGVDVPIGLYDEMVIVEYPIEKGYVASKDVIKFADELDLIDEIATIGFEPDKDNKKLLKVKIFAGESNEPDVKTLVKEKVDYAILDSSILADKKLSDKEIKSKQEILDEVTEHLSLLKIPVIIDRSEAEKDDLAKYEWIKFYGAMFGKYDEAKKLYDTYVKENKDK